LFDRIVLYKGVQLKQSYNTT